MALTRYNFESGVPSIFAAATTAGWTVISDADAVSGTTQALRSAVIGNTSATEWTVTVTLLAATPNFRVRYKVDSETGWDWFRVLDGITQLFSDSGTTGGWESYQTTLSAGSHTLKFRYDKDSSGAGGSDSVRIAYVELDAPVVAASARPVINIIV